MTETPETYLAITLVARIHPGDREAIEETIQNILCPFGHFDEPGDQPWPDHSECRMDWFASTGVKDIETALNWVSPDVLIEVPDNAATLDSP